MTTDQPGPDRIDALLNEQGASDPAERAALRDLLGAAGSPARSGELRGEAAARALFRASVGRSSAQPPAEAGSRPAMNKRTLATVFSVKAAAVVIALTGMGGVALAASTGTLPGPIDGPRHTTDKVEQQSKPDGGKATEVHETTSEDRAEVPDPAAARAAKKLAALRGSSKDDHGVRRGSEVGDQPGDGHGNRGHGSVSDGDQDDDNQDRDNQGRDNQGRDNQGDNGDARGKDRSGAGKGGHVNSGSSGSLDETDNSDDQGDADVTSGGGVSDGSHSGNNGRSAGQDESGSDG